MKPGKGALTPIAGGFLRWNAMSDQADRQRQLNVAVPALVAIDEILQEERNVALLQIAAPAQLLGDVGGNVLRPVLRGVKGNHADRAFILALEQVENDRLEFAA